MAEAKCAQVRINLTPRSRGLFEHDATLKLGGGVVQMEHDIRRTPHLRFEFRKVGYVFKRMSRDCASKSYSL